MVDDQGRGVYESQGGNYDVSLQRQVLLAEKRIRTFLGSVFESYTLQVTQ